jgi:hypothetical protein
MESWQNSVLLESQVGEMLMKHLVDKAGEWLNSKLTKQQFNKTKNWQNSKRMKRQVDEIANWWNVHDTSSWQNKKITMQMMKHHVENTANEQNSNKHNCKLT